MCGVYLLEFAIGWVKVTGTLVSAPGQPFVAAILADAIVIVGVAGWEELVFRGYLIKNAAEGLNSKVIGAQAAILIAVLLPSLLFGWLHSTEVNATTSSVVNTMIFGLLFGAAYVLTGELALPIGLHFAWDLVRPSGSVVAGKRQGWDRSSSWWKIIQQRGCGQDGHSAWKAVYLERRHSSLVSC